VGTVGPRSNYTYFALYQLSGNEGVRGLCRINKSNLARGLATLVGELLNQRIVRTGVPHIKESRPATRKGGNCPKRNRYRNPERGNISLKGKGMV